MLACAKSGLVMRSLIVWMLVAMLYMKPVSAADQSTCCIRKRNNLIISARIDNNPRTPGGVRVSDVENINTTATPAPSASVSPLLYPGDSPSATPSVALSPSPSITPSNSQILGMINGTVIDLGNEVGVPDIVVILVNTATNEAVSTATTDANGGYSFLDLPLGEYNVIAPSEVITLPIVDGPPDSDDKLFEHAVVLNIQDPTEVGVDFKYLKEATIIGTVTLRNGKNEPLFGVQVGAICLDDSSITLPLAYTDDNGMYSFVQVPDCTWEIIVPPDFNGHPIVSDDPSGSGEKKEVTISPTVRIGVADFEYIPYATISGFVFNIDGNVPVSDVKIKLTCDGLSTERTTSDTGYYEFNALEDCEFTVLAPLTAFTDTFEGTFVGGSGPGDDGDESYVVVVDTDNRGKANVNYFYQSATKGSLSGTLRDYVTKDPIPAGEVVEVACIDGPNREVSQTTTNDDGFYKFSGLDFCTYSVNAPQQTVDGRDIFEGPVDGVDPEHTTTVLLSEGAPDETDIDFEYSSTGSIAGNLFEDTPPTGVPGEQVTAVCLGNSELAYTATTCAVGDAACGVPGSYRFTNLPLCTYTVTVPTTVNDKQIHTGQDTDDTLNAVDIPLTTADQVVEDVDFYYGSPVVPATIDGTVTLLPTGEPIAGVEVTATCLSDPGITLAPVSTDANGYYSFSDVPNCAWTISVPDEVNSVPVTPPTDSPAVIDSENRVAMVDFDYKPIGAISGHTLDDFDDSPISGMLVTLVCSEDGSMQTQTTGEAGDYSFENLKFCTYMVSVLSSSVDVGPIVSGYGDLEPLYESSVSIDDGNRVVEGVDFKYLAQGTIAGTLRDYITQAGIGSQTVTVLCASTGATRETTTNGAGEYRFENLAFCDYTVTVPDGIASVGPIYEGYGVSVPINEAIVSIGLSEPAVGDVDFEYTTLGSVSGAIYVDAADAENGFFGAPVQLTCTDRPDLTPFTETTDDQGRYSFTDIPICAYEIEVPLIVDSKPIASGYDADDSLQLATVTLTIAEPNVVDVNFLYLLPISPSATVSPSPSTSRFIPGTITGTVELEGTDIGVPGITVTATCTDGTVYNETTDGDGSFSFEDMPDCQYTIIVPPTDPNGWPVVSTGETEVEISPENRTEEVEFEYTPLGSIAGATLSDFDKTTPIADLIVELSCDGAVVQTQTTGSLGEYSFTELPPCLYTVTVPTSATDGGDLVSGPSDPAEVHQEAIQGNDVTELNFYYLPKGTIAGTLSHHVTEVPLTGENVTIACLDNPAVTITNTTDASGNYEFTNLVFCTYSVVAPESTPAGPIFSGPDDFSGDDGLEYATVVILNPQSPEEGDVDFTYAEVGSVSGTIYEDFIGEGNGVGEVLVTLECTGANTFELTVLTDGAGEYAFAEIPICDYIITVPQVVNSTSGVIPLYSGYDTDTSLDTAKIEVSSEAPNIIEVNFIYKMLPSTTASPSPSTSPIVPAVISGTVSGLEDGAGIPGVPVTAACTTDGNIVYTTTTIADGSYAFSEGVADCTYAVSVPENFDGEPIKGPSSETVSITPTERTAEADFTYLPLGTISGLTLNDFDQSPLPNVTVMLTCAAVMVPTTTDGSGFYLFENLEDCIYTVTVPPSVLTADFDGIIVDGPVDSDSQKEIHSIEINSDNLKKDNVDFKYLPQGTISGNLQDFVSTVGIVNQTVTLTCTDPETSMTTQTDENGNYEFHVTVICTANTSNFYEVQTNADGTYVIDDVKDCDYTVSVPETFNGEPIKGLSSKTVSITPADRTGEADFVYVPLGTISGYTLNDFDQSPLATVEVTLSCKGVDETRTTNTSGYYIFENLGDCNYTVTAPPSVSSDDFEGIIVKGPEDDDTVKRKHDVNINSNNLEVEQVNFKYLPQGTISGNLQDFVSTDGIANETVTLTCTDPETSMSTQTDADGNLRDFVSSDGIESQTVTVTCSDPEISKSTQTEADGSYEFTGLGYCEYTVVAPGTVDTVGDIFEGPIDEDGVISSTKVDITFADPSEVGVDFSYTTVGSISGTIYEDTSAPSNGVKNVTITLVCTEADNYSLTRVTDADGSYAFNGIPLCEYTISVPEEVSATGGTKPIYEGHDNDDTKTEADVTIDLAQKDVIDVDFLYKVPAVISGTVTGYEDGE
ncbi:hypothetical protein SARC_03446, partial [Sphaeroforma arctica JP610]